MNRIKSQCFAIDTIVTYIWYAIGFERFLLTVLKVGAVHVHSHTFRWSNNFSQIDWKIHAQNIFYGNFTKFNFGNFQVEKSRMNHDFPLTGNCL